MPYPHYDITEKLLIFILFYILHDLQVPFFSFNSVDTFDFLGAKQSHTSCKGNPCFFFFERQRKEFYFII